MVKVLFLGIALGIYVVSVNAGWTRIHGDADKSLAELEQTGTWTGFINYDSSTGMGDYETVAKWVERYNQKFSGTCKLWCRDPLAVKWEVIPQSFYVNTLAEIEDCAYLTESNFHALRSDGQTNPMKGFYCINGFQKRTHCSNSFCLDNELSTYDSKRESIKCDKCPDFQVNYLCPNTVPKPPGDCPADLEREMSDLDLRMLMNEKDMQEVRVLAEREMMKQMKRDHAEVVEHQEQKVENFGDNLEKLDVKELEKKLMEYLAHSKK